MEPVTAGREFSAKELQDRLTFLGLDQAALQALRSIKPIVDRELPRALDKFYVRAQATPETSAFFADPAMIERAKSGPGRALAAALGRRVRGPPAREHAAHRRDPCPHRPGAEMVRGRLRHDRRPPDRGDDRGDLAQRARCAAAPRATARTAGAALSALVRVILLDFELATSAYLDALDQRRDAAEQIAAQVARETQPRWRRCARPSARLAAKNLDCRLADGLAGAYRPMAADFNAAVDGPARGDVRRRRQHRIARSRATQRDRYRRRRICPPAPSSRRPASRRPPPRSTR